MSSKQAKDLPPPVLILSFPVQGHLNSMLNLAQLFCLSGFHVTFIVSDFNHRRLLRHSTVPATFSRYPRFQFRTLSDGLPDDHPRAGERVMDITSSVTEVTVPLFKKMMLLENFLASDARRPVTCFLADGLMSFAAEFAEENRIPLIYFRTATASYFWALFRFPHLLQDQQIPFQGEGKSMDGLVENIPGMEGHKRPYSTREDLEGPIVAQIQKHVPRIFSIGPIHEQTKTRLAERNEEASISTASLWAEDQSCVHWLDAQPPKSVVYVSFGSITLVTREQALEFWHGLVNSSQRFVSEVWKIGLDIKDTCDRSIIEKAIRDLMEVRKEEFLERAQNMAKLVKESVSKEGSSYKNLDNLIQYIKSLLL
ncbi:hypothetical protein SASPL_123476 [Salvia splendens]|uniref:Uncharacterized protein n=1 Tax=Salvia splendens TaxID=180675 RepID=A0A8X8ZU01_SALSN|nr:hypothetical protein SASPL_123476 [Salvia splendens]